MAYCVSTGANLIEKLFMNMYLYGTISQHDKDVKVSFALSSELGVLPWRSYSDSFVMV